MEIDCQNGDDRETVWKGTAILAMPGEPFGKRLPKRQWPGKSLEMDRPNGDARKSVWEAAAEWAGGGEVVGRPLPKWRWPGKSFGTPPAESGS